MNQLTDIGQRDKETTTRTLVDAVERVITRDGFRSVGVNAVAREAGVDKVLIYRYFGGFPELLEAYGEQGDFWWRVEDMIPDADDPIEPDLAAWAASVFRRHVSFLRHHPVTLEILAWEMVERNPLTVALESVREARSIELMRALADKFQADQAIVLKHLGPMMALFGAAGGYLVTRARNDGMRVFNGIDVQTDRGWAQINDTLEMMLRAFVVAIEIENGQ
ncbi:MAG: helix-turn-helix domain containing protein [Proteobacteria bacterium]|nr:helix-turn-helix domain containing protein [Pseudomonadota bacterium]